jgi:hypothetical protein
MKMTNMNPIKSVILFGLPILGGFVLAPVIFDVLQDGFGIYADPDGPIPTVIGLFICSLAMAFVYDSIVNGIGKKTKIALATIGALVILVPVAGVSYGIYRYSVHAEEARVIAVAKAERLATIHCWMPSVCNAEENAAYLLRPESKDEIANWNKVQGK